MTSTVIQFSQGQFAVAADGDVDMIAPTATVTDTDIALDNPGHTNVDILNYGGILSSLGIGLLYDIASSGHVVNEAGGAIAGATGFYTEAFAGVAVLNFGSITGTLSDNSDAAFYIASTAAFIFLDNRGMIFGFGAGVSDHASAGGFDVISNSGTIEGFTYGIDVNTRIGVPTSIVNSGTISGGNYSINVTAGHVGTVILTNTGHLIGDVSLESAAAGDSDTVVNSGSITGAVHLGAGNDLFDGTGGTSGAIFGEAGNDRLIGGPSSDILTGGPGADHFVFGAALGPTNIDHITDFTHGVDKIDLSHSIFGAAGALGKLAPTAFFAGAAAHDASDRIVYNPANGFVTYDVNGNHAGGAHHFATLAAHLHLTNADFLVVA